MKFASLDLESAVALPDDVEVYEDEHFEQLKISCTAVALSDSDNTIFWYSDAKGPMPRNECVEIVHDLIELVADGYTIVTWNGTGFDFRVLAIESGMFEECAELALHHIDMMLYVVFIKGHRLALNTALHGAGLLSKLKEVELNDGTIITDMAGSKAPELWALGERDAVLSYLEYDVVMPLQLLSDIQCNKCMVWSSKAGNPQQVKIPKLYTVKECFALPEPDTSWMDSAPDRFDFIKWMPNYKDRI